MGLPRGQGSMGRATRGHGRESEPHQDPGIQLPPHQQEWDKGRGEGKGGHVGEGNASQPALTWEQTGSVMEKVEEKPRHEPGVAFSYSVPSHPIGSLTSASFLCLVLTWVGGCIQTRVGTGQRCGRR